MALLDFFRSKQGPTKQEVIKELTDPSKKVMQALWRFMGTNMPVWKDDDTQEYVTYGYNYNYLIYAIIQWKAQKAADVPFRVYRMVNGKKEYIENHWCLELFDKPNEWQGRREFFEQLYGFKYIDGNGYVFAPKLENGINKGRVTEMHVLPSPITEIVTGDQWNPIGGYRVEYSGNANDFEAKDVIHTRYANYDAQYQSYVYGTSPLRAAWRNVQKSNSNIEASKKSFDNMGALGLLYQKSQEFQEELDDNARRRAQNQLDKKVRGTDQKGRVLWSTGDYGYINFGANPVDLALIEDEQLTVRQLCTAFHVQPRIFGVGSSSGLSNSGVEMREARKISYVDGIKPDVENFADEWNRGVMSPLGDERIEADWSSVPEMQADLKEMSEWLARSPQLTENEKRVIMGKEPLPGLDVNLYPANLLPIQFGPIDDPEKALSVYRDERK